MKLTPNQISFILYAMEFYAADDDDYISGDGIYKLTDAECKQLVRELLDEIPEEEKVNFQWAVTPFKLS